MAETMRLRPVRNGGNVVTALPYDRIVFERTWKEDDIVYASLAARKPSTFAPPADCPDISPSPPTPTSLSTQAGSPRSHCSPTP